jgi:hypothetical protein
MVSRGIICHAIVTILAVPVAIAGLLSVVWE